MFLKISQWEISFFLPSLWVLKCITLICFPLHKSFSKERKYIDVLTVIFLIQNPVRDYCIKKDLSLDYPCKCMGNLISWKLSLPEYCLEITGDSWITFIQDFQEYFFVLWISSMTIFTAAFSYCFTKTVTWFWYIVN